MKALVMLLGLLFLTMWLGSRIQRVTALTYALVAVIALLQVASVLFVMARASIATS